MTAATAIPGGTNATDAQQMRAHRIALANQQWLDQVADQAGKRNNMEGLAWLKQLMAAVRMLVARIMAKFSLRGGVSSESAGHPGSSVPTAGTPGAANFLNPGAGGTPSTTENPAEGPEADAARFGTPEAATANAEAAAADPVAQTQDGAPAPAAGENIVVTFECLPEQLQEVRNALLTSLQPLFDNPQAFLEENLPAARIAIAAEALGEQCERMRYVHRIMAREIMRLATDAINANPKAYAGLSPASLVESLRQHRGGRDMIADSYESRIVQQLQVQSTIRTGYDTYIKNAISLLDSTATPIERRAVKQIMMSAGTDTRVSLEQNEQRLLATANEKERQRFIEINSTRASRFDLEPFTKTLTEMDERALSHPAPTPAAVATPASTQPGVSLQDNRTSNEAIPPAVRDYLAREEARVKAQPKEPSVENSEALTEQVVKVVSAIATAPKQPFEPKIVSSTPFTANPTANSAGAALARAKQATPGALGGSSALGVAKPATVPEASKTVSLPLLATPSALGGSALSGLGSKSALIPDDDDAAGDDESLDENQGMIS